MPPSLLATLDTAGLDERLVRCAEHNTTFYATFPREWGLTRALQALGERFRAHGHQHVAFETIDLTCAPLPAPAGQTSRQRPAGTETLRLRRTARPARRTVGRLAWLPR